MDGISEIIDKLAPRLGDDVDDNDCEIMEDCRLFAESPAILNNLDKVSAGCIVAASVLVGSASLPAWECSDPAVVDRVVGRVTEIDEGRFKALGVRTCAVELLLDAASGNKGVAVGIVEKATAKRELSWLAAMRGFIDEEDIGTSTGVEVWMSAGIDGIPV